MNFSFCNIVNEYYVRQFQENWKQREARLAQLQTPEQAAAYAADVRTKIRAAFRLDREPRSPLNARTVSKTCIDNLYSVETVLFESRPGYFVTSALFLPAKISGKIPAVLHLIGHYLEGKWAAEPLTFAATMAASGFAVFLPDPVCQGERFQFLKKDGSLENCPGHNMLGKKRLLSGDFFGSWRAFDAIRALDYLLSRPEVDSSRCYAVGHSGGGTLTSWLNALDDRLAGSAPSCYITSWKRNVENEVIIDAEQTPPGLAAQGIEIADFLIASAPRDR